MRNPTDEEIANCLVGIISDGFNRSLGVLEDAGAINTKQMRKHYKGVGSKHYDLVTLAMTQTATYGAAKIRQLFQQTDSSNETNK